MDTSRVTDVLWLDLLAWNLSPIGAEETLPGRIEKLLGGGSVEATEPATIVVTEEDIAAGVPGDPRRCALAIAGRRTWGAGASIGFLRSVAYVRFFDRHSRPCAERFVMPAKTRAMIRAFDAGGTPPPGHYQLLPPSHHQTVAVSYVRAKAQREQAKAAGRKLVHQRRGPIDPLSFKRLQAFQSGVA